MQSSVVTYFVLSALLLLQPACALQLCPSSHMRHFNPRCLRSLSITACPPCRQLDRVKKLYLENPPKQDNAEQYTIDARYARLLRCVSLVSDEDTHSFSIAHFDIHDRSIPWLPHIFFALPKF
ncbi:hypothetical protein DEU56DRAFT_269207 [Suillus clintonianus]|uniref:uncharacterized protein n=1 Tax=Suillus clintonianus TaxID=1904413 RepID=UPI001B86527F|nr:uncharacterized protein DEU56DRAFT_269207 [Suillus clintonianus]KAG2141869.1 hypothetical protein DEU56DRAFT_269207 [Suillus clintonianus]